MTDCRVSLGVDYTDCISAEGKNSPNECPGYDTKQSDCEALVMLEFGECGVPLLLPSHLCSLWP